MKNKIKFLLKGLYISSDFHSKLKYYNFHTLTILEMVLYFIFFRPFWNKERKIFFEGSLGLLGQMYSAERRLLYDTIIKYRPRHCFEIGTYTGGGSTYFIAKAFEKIGSGKLITMEIDPYYHNKAKNYFENKISKIGKHVDFVLGAKPSMFDGYIEEYKDIDCVFLDGAEDSEQTLEQYHYFYPHFHKGTILMVHDWNTEKTRTLKPVLLGANTWKQLKEINRPESVGLAIFEKIA